MTNSAFQGGGSAVKLTQASAVHLKMCMAKAESILNYISALKGGVSHLYKCYVLFQ